MHGLECLSNVLIKTHQSVDLWKKDGSDEEATDGTSEHPNDFVGQDEHGPSHGHDDKCHPRGDDPNCDG